MSSTDDDNKSTCTLPASSCSSKVVPDKKGYVTEWGPELLQTPSSPSSSSNKPCEIQLSVHTVSSKAFLNEIKIIFPQQPWSQEGQLVMIATMQHSVMELVKMGHEVEEEKDRLLENFMDVSKALTDALIALGYFADYFDPCSGLPVVHTDCNKVFGEVNCAQSLLGYNVMNAGCCKILLHPVWGASVYPASMITNAPANVAIDVINQYKSQCHS